MCHPIENRYQQPCLPAACQPRHNEVQCGTSSAPQPIVNEIIIPPARQYLYLPAVRKRHHNERRAIANGIIIPVTTSLQEEIPTSTNIPPLPEKRTVTQLRKFIKDHNLQALVKQKTGKTYSKCNQQELLKVLET